MGTRRANTAAPRLSPVGWLLALVFYTAFPSTVSPSTVFPSPVSRRPGRARRRAPAGGGHGCGPKPGRGVARDPAYPGAGTLAWRTGPSTSSTSRSQRAASRGSWVTTTKEVPRSSWGYARASLRAGLPPRPALAATSAAASVTSQEKYTHSRNTGTAAKVPYRVL